MPNRTDAEVARDSVIERLERDVAALTEELKKYKEFLDLMIKREQDRAKLRQAVIEKSLTTLVGAAVTATLLMIGEGVRQWFRNLK